MTHKDNDLRCVGGRRIDVPTAHGMRRLGQAVAQIVTGGDILLLSGPLGAGKTTFAQGFGLGLHVNGDVVSPTFTIAREMDGRFCNGDKAHMVHVDAYRLGGSSYEPGQDSVLRLLDELESLGLDEELEDPDEHTVILMEWGEQMAQALASERLEIHIGRNALPCPVQTDDAQCKNDASSVADELSGDGLRQVLFTPVGQRWAGFDIDWLEAYL